MMVVCDNPPLLLSLLLLPPLVVIVEEEILMFAIFPLVDRELLSPFCWEIASLEPGEAVVLA